MANEQISTTVRLESAFQDGFETWLVKQALGEMQTVLLHAEEGIMWGRVEDNAVVWERDALASPGEEKYKVNPKTLMQVRLFDPAGELFVWRTRDGFQGRKIADGAKTQADVIEETQWLWGRHTGRKLNGFCELVEGQQGYVHAPPFDTLQKDGRLGLRVRHYVTYDKEGRATIHASRLVRLEKV